MSDPRLDGLLDEFARAVVGADRAALERLLGPDFEFVSADGRVFTRERRLAALAAGAASLVRLEFTERRVREWGPAAVLRARFLAELRPEAGGVRVDRGVSSFVLVRRREGWRIRHQHNSHLGAE
ncbi:MAG TPA: nuclear transport factor 2 family protein [Actinocrinis sp.]|nr:nuclear transport factor 2 family protein [Actinocrinis sp.]